jgi:lipopolysaccharide/colanic/teichoic acid biosynthesis glycosyltransferase
VSCPEDRRGAWARVLAGANVDAEMLVPELDAVGAIGLRRHGGHSTLLVGCGPLRLRDRVTKRMFDIGFSAAMLVLLLPLFALIALAIRVESPGPILFRQQRLGRANRLFDILKFRSMRTELSDQSGSRSASPDDDRVTRVGRFLRRTSLDELPQLLNVLVGEMSVVGPRPHPLGCRADDELFWNIDDHYFDRHSIKPGITGLAQVRGFRGATEKKTDVTDRLRADLEYLDGWHIGRDVAIVARTLGVLIHPRAF